MAKKSTKRSKATKRQSLWFAIAGAVVLVALLIGGQTWWNNRLVANAVEAAAYYEQFPTEGTRDRAG